jgi:hypothetical protein
MINQSREFLELDKQLSSFFFLDKIILVIEKVSDPYNLC